MRKGILCSLACPPFLGFVPIVDINPSNSRVLYVCQRGIHFELAFPRGGFSLLEGILVARVHFAEGALHLPPLWVNKGQQHDGKNVP